MQTSCFCPVVWQCDTAGPAAVSGGCDLLWATATVEAVTPRSDAPYLANSSYCRDRQTMSVLQRNKTMSTNDKIKQSILKVNISYKFIMQVTM